MSFYKFRKHKYKMQPSGSLIDSFRKVWHSKLSTKNNL